MICQKIFGYYTFLYGAKIAFFRIQYVQKRKKYQRFIKEHQEQRRGKAGKNGNSLLSAINNSP